MQKNSKNIESSTASIASTNKDPTLMYIDDCKF